MLFFIERWTLVTLLVVCVAAPAGAQTTTVKGPSPAKKADAIPKFATVKKVVEAALSRDPDYRPGDLLSQRPAGEALRNVKAAGWDVPKSRELLSAVPGDDEFLVQTLRSDKGAAFMRHVAGMPGGYDRVDRLSRIPGGQATIERLINTPGGHKMIEYMTTTKGGAQLGSSLGQVPAADEFNRPTGRIYTAKQLLAELERRHAAASKAK